MRMNCKDCVHYEVCKFVNENAEFADYCLYAKTKVSLKELERNVKKIDEDVKKLLEEDQSLHLNLDWDGFEARGENNADM